MADEVRLGRDGTRAGWTYAAVIAAATLAASVWVVAQGAWTALFATTYFPALVLLGLVVSLTRLGDDELVLGADTVRARTRGQVQDWDWDDVLEVGISRMNLMGPYLSPGLTVWVRPEGRAFDAPGPNAPFPVTLPVFGRRAHRRATAALATACAAHGVPLSRRRGLRMATQPRPGSPLRTDRGRSAP